MEAPVEHISSAKSGLPSQPARLLLWLAPAIILLAAIRSVSFQPRGETADYLAAQAARYPQGQAPIAWPAANPSGLEAPQPLDSVTVAIWFLAAPEAFDAGTIFAERLERGRDAGGQLAYYIEFDEAGLTRYLNHWFGEWARQTVQLQDARVDLKPGGLIIYADVNLGLRSQRVGAAFNLDTSGRQFAFAGVDIDGQLLASPPDGPIAEGLKALEANGNRALRELKIVDPEGELSIRQIVLSEDRAQIIAR